MAGVRYVRYIVISVICLSIVLFLSSGPATRRFKPQTGAFRYQFTNDNDKDTPAPADDYDEYGPDALHHGEPTPPPKPSKPASHHKLSGNKHPQMASAPGGYDDNFPDPGLTTTPAKPALGTTNGMHSGPKVNATFVTLARNSDVWDIAASIREVEDRFNRKFKYDWVFLNDEEFDDEFRRVTTALVSGNTKYGLIPEKHWSFPDFIDQEKAAAVRKKMAEDQIIYGDSISYRHMCRFESGFFFQQDLMRDYEWYWRVEPSIKLFCDIDYDVFKYMADHGKKYSFTISLYEYRETIPTLWDSVKTFMREHPEHMAEDNSMDFLSDDGGDTYNKCHFWSNFEIGNLNWLRSQAYTDYFNRLDQDGGFFYERWGDAPVHSIAAGLLLNKDEIHFFNDIAYYHVPFTHCPTGEQFRLDHRCSCKPHENFDWNGYSCTARFFELQGWEKPEGYEDEQDQG